MVKGISRQVIMVRSPEPKLFEQAIFILKEDAVGKGITDEELLKEAKQAVGMKGKPRRMLFLGPLWACGGAVAVGVAWLLSNIL